MRKIWSLGLILLILSGCGSGLSKSTPTGKSVSASPSFDPSVNPTASFTTSPSPTPIFVNIPTPTLTLYVVVLNDNPTSIAKKFNITLEELLAANPTIGSQPLTVGLVLTIPTGLVYSTEPITTPVPVSIQQLKCYPNQDGSSYCLALLKNDQAETLLNLSVVINLVDSDGTILASQIAYSPLDLLPPGKSIPISALFPAPMAQESRPQARVLSASHLASARSSYPSISLVNSLVEVDWGGLNAHIIGQAILSLPGLQASRVWILGIAYDLDGNVIGFTRWDSKIIPSHPELLPFQFMVASLGPQIDHVELLVEALK